MMKWLKRGVIGLLLVLALLAAAGYFWLPGFIQRQAAQAVQKELGRTFSLGELQINPLTLQVEASNAVLYEPDARTPFASVAQVSAQLSWASLRRLAPVVNHLTLKGVRANIVRTQANTFNFSDIQAKLAAKPPSEPAKFALYNIALENAEIHFDDRVVQQKHAITQMNLSVPFVSNLPHDVKVFVKPAFSALMDGKRIGLEGQTKPFDQSHESALNLNLSDVNLVSWLGYSPVALPFSVRSAELARLDVRLVFNQAAQTQLELTGDVGLRNLAIAEKGAPAAALPAISVASVEAFGFALAPLQHSVKIGRVEISGWAVAAKMNEEGTLNLQKMFAFPASSAAPAPAAAPAKPWQIELDSFKLNAGALQFDDARPQSAMTLRASEVSFMAHALQHTSPPHQLQSSLYPLDAPLQLAGEAKSLKPMRWPSATGVPIRGTLAANLALGKSNKPPAKLAVQAYLEPTHAVTADLQLSGVLLETLAPLLAQQGVALDMAGTAQLKAQLKRAPSGELSTPQTTLEVAGLRLGLPQSESPVSVQKTSVQLSNSTLLPQQALNLTAALNFADASYAKVAGTVARPKDLPLAAALKLDVAKLDALPLLALVPQALSAFNVRPSSGFVSALGDVTLKGSAIQWTGGLALDAVQVQDGEAQDLLKLGKLSAVGMRIDTGVQPIALHAGAVTVQDGFARLLLNAQGKLNVTGLLKPPAAGAAPPAPSTAAAPAINLDGVTVVNTSIDFSDNLIQPNYRTNLSQLTGSIGAMSSTKPEPAEVALKGSIEGTGELSINGKLNPFGSALFTDISAKATGIELTQLSPYSAKYADYNIVKGKLSAQLNYFIDQGQLKASNKIKIDQLTFGDNKMGSADATKLPVKLAVALLKDRKGVIEVDLPISGSLSDPSFSVGRLVWQVLGNLVVKAVTSPFALLGSLFGGGETLSYLDFAPGSAALDAAGKTKLDALAKALNDRPALKLDITGRADAGSDTEGLRQAWLNSQLRSAKVKALLKQNKSLSAEQVSLVAGDELTYLVAAYGDAAFSKPRNLVGLSKTLPAADMQKLMLTNAPISADAILALASQRANAVQTYLQASVDKEQLFLVQAGDSKDAAKNGPKDAKPSRVDFSLK